MSLANTINGMLLSLQEEGKPIKEWEYLIHHLHEDGKTEEVHHCPLVDHLGNLFEIEHIDTPKGIRHVLKGIVEDQKVYWSDEEAKVDGQSVPCANRQLT